MADPSVDEVAECAARLRKNEKCWVLRETHTMPDSVWHGEWCGHLIEMDPNSSTNWQRTQLCRDVEAFLRQQKHGPASPPANDDAYTMAVKTLRRCWHEHETLSEFGDPGDEAFEDMVGAVVAGMILEEAAQRAAQASGPDKPQGE